MVMTAIFYFPLTCFSDIKAVYHEILVKSCIKEIKRVITDYYTNFVPKLLLVCCGFGKKALNL
jgi:hypothetical protein